MKSIALKKYVNNIQQTSTTSMMITLEQTARLPLLNPQRNRRQVSYLSTICKRTCESVSIWLLSSGVKGNEILFRSLSMVFYITRCVFQVCIALDYSVSDSNSYHYQIACKVTINNNFPNSEYLASGTNKESKSFSTLHWQLWHFLY